MENIFQVLMQIISWFRQQLLLWTPTCTASVSNSCPHQEDLQRSSYDQFVEDYLYYVKEIYIGNGVHCLYHSAQFIYHPWNEMCYLHFRFVCTVDGRLCLYSIRSALSHQTNHNLIDGLILECRYSNNQTSILLHKSL